MEAFSKEERRERIKFLCRQEDRKKRLPLLLGSLSKMAGKEVSEKDVLTLEEIDHHDISLNGSDFDFNYLNISFPQEQVSVLQEKVSSLASESNQINYLTLYEWSEIAVVRLNTTFVVENIAKLIALDKRRFYIHDLNYRNGLWVNLYQEYWFLEGTAKLRQILELRVFGKEWMKKVTSTL